MKRLLLTTIAAVVLVGCGEMEEAKRLQFINDIGLGNIEAVKQHLAAGADVNEKEVVMGNTPLHDAALGGHKEIAELLISKGADLNAKNDRSETPLDLATHPSNPNASPEIADLLQKHSAK